MKCMARAAADVGRAEHLAQVPLAARSRPRWTVFSKICDALGEVAAHDHRVRPHVAHQVRGQVRGERGEEADGPDSSGWIT